MAFSPCALQYDSVWKSAPAILPLPFRLLEVILMPLSEDSKPEGSESSVPELGCWTLPPSFSSHFHLFLLFFFSTDWPLLLLYLFFLPLIFLLFPSTFLCLYLSDTDANTNILAEKISHIIFEWILFICQVLLYVNLKLLQTQWKACVNVSVCLCGQWENSN